MRKEATIKDIAFELGKSPSTVSRALQNHPRISKKTRDLVHQKALELKYVPNPAAKLLRANKTQTIGLLLPWLKEEFFSLLLTAIEDVVSSQGYHIIVCQSRDNLEREKKLTQSLLSHRIDGLIAAVSAETNHYGHFKQLEEHGIPTIFLDRTPRNYACNKVVNNSTSGATEAIRFLVARGVRNIGMINAPGNLQVAEERLNGYLEAILELGLQTRPQYIKSTNLTMEETEKCMAELASLPNPPQGILAFNDYVAMQAMNACRNLGIIPNKDILFVSFGNLPITAFMENPPLASVEQFAYEMGEKAARLLLKNIGDQKIGEPYDEVVINTELIVH